MESKYNNHHDLRPAKSGGKRRVLRYTNGHQSEEYVARALESEPLQGTMAGARRGSTDKATGAAIPSDDDVEEMRDWSIESKL